MTEIARQVEEVLANFERDFNAGEVSRGELQSRIWKILDEHNVDAVVAALPDPHRLELIQSLRGCASVATPSELIILFFGTRIETEEQAIAREREEANRKERDWSIARAWASRNAVSLDEIRAAASEFIDTFDFVFVADWSNTQRALGMSPPTPNGELLLREIFGETGPPHPPGTSFLDSWDEGDNWGNHTGLVESRTALVEFLKRDPSGVTSAEAKRAVTALLKYFERVFHHDWHYTKVQIGADDSKIDRRLRSGTFLGPAPAAVPYLEWGGCGVLQARYETVCALIGRKPVR